MTRTNKEIINDIRLLLDELDGITTEKKSSKSTDRNKKKQSQKPVGCIGAITVLIDEGFLDAAKGVAEVENKLKEEGQPYSRELVSMNLLNLVKPPRRVLRRIKEGNKWLYIVRK